MPVIFVWNAFGLETARQTVRSRQTTTRSAVKEGPTWTVRADTRKSDFDARLRDAVLSMRELGPMAPTDILVVFPKTQVSPPDLTLISIDILFAAEHRTREMREKLAEKLKAAALKAYAEQGIEGECKIEVAVRRFGAQADVCA